VTISLLGPMQAHTLNFSTTLILYFSKVFGSILKNEEGQVD